MSVIGPDGFTNLARQSAEIDHLARAKDEAGRHHDPHSPTTAASPDERTVPYLLSGILDALIAIAERLPEPTPAPRTPTVQTDEGSQA